jgi:hypothetical protein
MSATRVLRFIVLVPILAAASVWIGAGAAGPPVRHIAPGTGPVTDGPGPLPAPIPLPPEPQVLIPSGTIQVVGYTGAQLPANRGILNMTCACNAEFPGSRLCTVDEVLASFVPPEPPRDVELAYLWVRSAGTVAGQLLGRTAPETAAVDCRGWTSASKDDQGVAMAVGPQHACFGGMVEVACDHELALACCGLVP